jgi:hypothetical protein
MTRTEAAFYQRAHASAELRTFHCEEVRKMPLSRLDPSMLLSFVCSDEGLAEADCVGVFVSSSSFSECGAD